MPSLESRQRLAARQAELVHALCVTGEPPPAFDARLFSATAHSLASKRLNAVKHEWPDLVQDLGDDFDPCFAKFAAVTSLPQFGGPLADGLAFAAFLATVRDLSNATRLRVLSVDLRYVCSPAGLLPRRGLSFKAARLRGPRSLVFAVRVPWLGERWWIWRWVASKILWIANCGSAGEWRG